MTQSQGRDLFWVVAVSSAIIVAVATTWLLSGQYPALENEASVLGLLSFFSVASFVPFLIYRLLKRDFRKGYRVEAITSSGALILVGLLVASLAGLLFWFISLDPWPWKLILVMLSISEIMIVIGAWLERRGRKESRATV